MEHACPSCSSEAGKAGVCEGCPGRGACLSQSGGVGASSVDAQLAVRLGAIRHKVLVLSGKGGVGKSTVAVGLAVALAKQGRRVGLLDTDLCGPSTVRMLGLEHCAVQNKAHGWQPPKCVDNRLAVMSSALLLPSRNAPLIYRGPRKEALLLSMLRDTFWSKLDFLIVDFPPGTSDEHITMATLLKGSIDGAVLVATPQDVALDAVRKEVTFCNTLGIPLLGFVENFSAIVCPCCGHLEPLTSGANRSVEELAKKCNVPVLCRLPLLADAGEAADAGRFADLTGTPLDEPLKDLAKKVDGALWKDDD